MVQENINAPGYAREASTRAGYRGGFLQETPTIPDYTETDSAAGYEGDFITEEPTPNKEKRELRGREREEEKNKKPKWVTTDFGGHLSSTSGEEEEETDRTHPCACHQEEESFRSEEEIETITHHCCHHHRPAYEEEEDERHRSTDSESSRRESTARRWKRDKTECEGRRIIIKEDMEVFEEKTKLLTKDQKELLQQYHTVIGLKQKNEKEFSAYITINREDPTPVITEVKGIKKVKRYLKKEEISPCVVETLKVNRRTQIEKTFTATIFHNTHTYEYIEKHINIKVNPTEKSISYIPGSPPSTPESD